MQLPDAASTPPRSMRRGYLRVEVEWGDFTLERDMVVKLQIRYLGFIGSPSIESEASVQSLRLAPFDQFIRGCHLAIEAFRDAAGVQLYDSRLDLITRDFGIVPIEHSTNGDPHQGILQAFNGAVQLLENRLAIAKPDISAQL
jgi:hypothetical protein